ncbi:MAG: ABC transporter ATP-binding protein [Synechococcus lacustris]
MNAPASPLRVQGLRFRWPNGAPALDHCSFSLPGPGLWMLVGGNGSGKSTLLRLIAGLLQPEAGEIFCTAPPALVFQNPDHQLLLPGCGSELCFHLPKGQRPDLATVEAALARVGLAGFASRPIHSLSGGQKQRLAIASALISGARLLLLDEPTALLDPQSQGEVLALIRKLCNGPSPKGSAPLTALWVTHRLEELELCDGALHLERGRPGRWQKGPALRLELEGLPRGRATG